MENNKNIMRELYELYLELGHEVFEEKIKKPMELHYLHNTHVSSNVTSISSLNTFDANDMQSYKLGDATFYEDDLFSPPIFDEEIYFDDTLPPIYDDYCYHLLLLMLVTLGPSAMISDLITPFVS